MKKKKTVSEIIVSKKDYAELREITKASSLEMVKLTGIPLILIVLVMGVYEIARGVWNTAGMEGNVPGFEIVPAILMGLMGYIIGVWIVYTNIHDRAVKELRKMSDNAFGYEGEKDDEGSS